MKKLLEQIYSSIDKEWIHQHVKALTAIERKQTFDAYALASDYVYRLLLENDFDAERMRFPADGETVYQDKRMPLAWDANVGRMTILSSPISFNDPVVADFEKEPFSLIKHSVLGFVSRLTCGLSSRFRKFSPGKDIIFPPHVPTPSTTILLGNLGLEIEINSHPSIAASYDHLVWSQGMCS
jgi:hypothetical protein